MRLKPVATTPSLGTQTTKQPPATIMLSHFVDRLERLSRRWTDMVSQRTGLAIGLLMAISGLCYLPGQTILPAIDRTEGVVALSSRQIAQTDDLFDPRWGENLQVFRPAGTFWLQAAAVSLRGEDHLLDVSAYRLPSYLASVLAVVLLFALGRRLFGAKPALLAALAVGVTPIIALHAQLAIAEPLILPLTVTSQLALFGIYSSPGPPRWFGWRALFWIALGISTWFNALAVPLLALVTVLGLVTTNRSLRLIGRLAPWVGLPIFVVAALPWLYSLTVIGDGQPFSGLDWYQTLEVLEGGQEMKFNTPHGVFVLFVALAFIPVSHMLGPAVVRAWAARRERAVHFLLVWLIVPVVALEIFSNKPPLYTVQAVFPAAALLVGLAMTGRLGIGEAFKAWPGFFTGASLFAIIVIPLFAGALLWLTATPPTLAVVIGGAAIIALFVVAGWAAAKGQSHAWFSTAIAATIALDLWFFGALMPRLRNTWTAPQVRGVVDDLRACGVRDIVIAGFREPSLPLAIGDKARILMVEEADWDAELSKAWTIVETREYKAIGGGLPYGRPISMAIEPRGCIRSIDLAQGCLLEFLVRPPARPVGDDPPAGQASCELRVPRACRPIGRDEYWPDLKQCD